MENRKYSIQSADETGHTTTADLSVEEAMENIVDNAANKARWVFINGEPFNFEGNNYRSEANLGKLRQNLEAVEDPLVMIMNKVVGG